TPNRPAVRRPPAAASQENTPLMLKRSPSIHPFRPESVPVGAATARLSCNWSIRLVFGTVRLPARKGAPNWALPVTTGDDSCVGPFGLLRTVGALAPGRHDRSKRGPKRDAANARRIRAGLEGQFRPARAGLRSIHGA